MSEIFKRSLFNVEKIIAAAIIAASSTAFVHAQTKTNAAPNQPSAVAAVAQTAAASVNSPTAAVQNFYKAMRERRFRDALMMTNLRVAVETLTAAELEDLRPDFEPMASRVPAQIETGGEQISNNLASVYIKSTSPATGEPSLDELKLKSENGNWTILTGDPETEAQIKREGKNYFFNLRIETRHADVELTLQDVIKAELAYGALNNNVYANLQTLAAQHLIPADVLDPQIMGYRFKMQLSPDKKKYTVNAEPVAYGKTGKLSFLLESSANGRNSPKIQNADKNGAALSAKN